MTPRWRPLDDDRQPRHIGESLERVVPGGRTFTTLLKRWPELAGEALAAHVRPTALHATTLVLTVDDPAWATQLKYLQTDLVTRLGEALGTGRVTDLRVVVRPA